MSHTSTSGGSTLPFKTLIGQVLLDKSANIETVINKTLDVGIGVSIPDLSRTRFLLGLIILT